MAFNGLLLDEHDCPSDRQPVPIILAALIARMPVDDYLKLCSVESDEFRLGINAYHYIKDEEPRKVQPKMLLNYISTAANPLDKSELANVFVWSDELHQQISFFIDEQYETRKDASADGVYIDWEPAQLGCSEIIAKSSDFYSLLTPKLKTQFNASKRTKNAQLKYKKWCEYYLSKNPHVTIDDIKSKKNKDYSQVAGEIERNPELNPDGNMFNHIREMIRKNIKKHL